MGACPASRMINLSPSPLILRGHNRYVPAGPFFPSRPFHLETRREWKGRRRVYTPAAAAGEQNRLVASRRTFLRLPTTTSDAVRLLTLDVDSKSSKYVCFHLPLTFTPVWPVLADLAYWHKPPATVPRPTRQFPPPRSQKAPGQLELTISQTTSVAARLKRPAAGAGRSPCWLLLHRLVLRQAAARVS